MDNFKSIGFENTRITGGFWAERQKLNREVTIRSVLDRFEETGRFEAFKFNWKEGSDVPKPHFFWDSDVAKWLESAAYMIALKPDNELENKIEEVIDLIEKNQDENGYFNIYHTVAEPDIRFKNRDHHELYCLGHLIEAAVAYYNATGKDRFLNLMDKYIDLVIRVFTVEKSAGFVTPGHEEIELALIKLYRLKKDRKYLDLAMFFIDERGKREENNLPWCTEGYNQSRLPVREQTEAEGHCVRACYLYSAMADAARETGDERLLSACKALFEDIEKRKSYITGGIGSSHHGEAFTIPFDLPNDTAYAETCASIALSMFADRMKNIDFDSKYADMVEREMYNGVLAGVSLDGKAFFYENPLEINLSDRSRYITTFDNDRLPITQRLEVFGCSCCPPNVTRYIASIAGSIFSLRGKDIALHQFMNGESLIDGVKISVKTAYPLDGKIRITLTGGKGRRLFVRIPGWCARYTFSKNYTAEKGYACIDIDGDEFTLDVEFVMEAVIYTAHPSVRFDEGKKALLYGPVVYCLEGQDNEGDIHSLKVDTCSEFCAEYDPYFGVNVITCGGYRSKAGANAPLYSRESYPAEKTEVKFIPYFGFANRGEDDMAVWFSGV